MNYLRLVGLLVFAITSLVALIPISISGLGTRDAILIALLSFLGISAETAVAYSALILVTFYVAAGSIGAIASVAPLDLSLIKRNRVDGKQGQSNRGKQRDKAIPLPC